jgi:hypothetical protein
MLRGNGRGGGEGDEGIVIGEGEGGKILSYHDPHLTPTKYIPYTKFRPFSI